MVMGALRHLLGCSLPHNNTGGRESDSEIEIKKEASPEEKQELQNVWRHLEVRWQMFNEALSKFCDLEALLALCTDDVVWSNNKGDLTRGKDKELLLFLHSLIAHKLSLEVEVERVTKLTSTGCLGLALDKDGNYGKLSGSETHKENETLDMFLPTRKRHELDGAGSGDYLPLMVLERDFYILHNDQGWSSKRRRNASSSTRKKRSQNLLKEIIARDFLRVSSKRLHFNRRSFQRGEKLETGRRFVLWKQCNTTWYILGYRSCPMEIILPMV